MANIPVNFGGLIITAGQSATGSFAGMMSLGTGSQISSSQITGSFITAMKYGGSNNTNGSINEITSPASFTLPAGTSLNLFITSCSLAAGSAPVILFY